MFKGLIKTGKIKDNAINGLIIYGCIAFVLEFTGT